MPRPWPTRHRRAPTTDAATSLQRFAERWRRSALLRRALRSRALAVLVAVLVAAFVAHSLQHAEATRDGWGRTRTVAVAGRELLPGHLLGPEDVTLEQLPERLVPPSALESAPQGRRVSERVLAGEVLAGERLSAPGRRDPLAGLGDDAAVLQLPLGGVGSPTFAPTLERGDVVDVHAARGVDGVGSDVVGPVARDALVLAAEDDGLTVRIRRSEASAVAAAMQVSALVVVLVG